MTFEARRVKVNSWNVNGIRAAAKKGFLDWVRAEDADIICLQETKARKEQLEPTLQEIRDSRDMPYHCFYASAKRPGYSGTALFAREEPLSVSLLGVPEFDDEGRYIEADFSTYAVASAYFPNSQEGGARLDYKLRYCEAVLCRAKELASRGKHLILSGDYNIAHTPIDLYHPKENEGNPGYLPEERDFMTKFLASGFADVFRRFHEGEPGHYTWWSYRTRAREKDIGWRLDYHCVNEAFFGNIKETSIQKAVLGSDHCPIQLVLEL
mgnify:CR=1 FL=1